jgi:hypothetical protein
MYYEVKPEVEAEGHLDYLEWELAALNLAANMDVDQAEAILRVELGTEAAKMSSKEIKRDLILLARKNPQLFVELAKDDNLLLDKDWTPTGVSATPSKVVPKVGVNKQAEIDRLTKVADRLKTQIRNNRQLTSKQRTKALKEIDADLAKDIANIP